MRLIGLYRTPPAALGTIAALAFLASSPDALGNGRHLGFCLGVGNPHHTADCTPSTAIDGSQPIPDVPPVTNTDPGGGTPALVLPGNPLPPTGYAIPPLPAEPKTPQPLQILVPPLLKQRVPPPPRQKPKQPPRLGPATIQPGGQVPDQAQYPVPPLPPEQKTPQPLQILAPPLLKQRVPPPPRQTSKQPPKLGPAAIQPGGQVPGQAQYPVPPLPPEQKTPQPVQVVAPPLLQQLIPALRPRKTLDKQKSKPGAGAPGTPAAIARPVPKPGTHRPGAPAQAQPGSDRPTATHTPQPVAGHDPHQHVTPGSGRQPAHAIPRFTDAARGGTVDCIASGFHRRFHDDAPGRRVVSGVLPHVEIPDAISRDVPAEKPLHAGCIVKVKRKYRSR